MAGTLKLNGRKWRVSLPATRGNSCLVMLHGNFQTLGTGSKKRFGIETDFVLMCGDLEARANDLGIAVFWPEGIQGVFEAWDASDVPTMAQSLEEIRRDYTDLVVAGFSDGGGFTNDLVAACPGIQRAVIHSGSYSAACGTGHSRPNVLIIQGRRDSFAPRWLWSKWLSLHHAARAAERTYRRNGFGVEVWRPDIGHRWWSDGNDKILKWCFGA